MRRFLAVFLILALLPAISLGEDVRYVRGATSDRVHLRSGPSTSTASLGLLFTGTPVVVLGETKGFTEVLVGAQHGYIKSDLVSGFPGFLWLWTPVTSNTAVYDAPGGTRIGSLRSGDSVSLMGETHEHWGYVFTAAGLVGYVPTKALAVTEERACMGDIGLPIQTPQTYYYSSGVGAWHSTFTLFSDGAFVGYYTDADMGDGIRYESCFWGALGNLSFMEGEVRAQVVRLQSFAHDRWENGLWVQSASPGGVGLGDAVSFYFGNSALPDDYVWQMELLGVDPYQEPGLYIHEQESAWVMEW